MNIKSYGIIGGIALLMAILNLPYDFYILLRWLVFALSLILIFEFKNLKKTNWIVTFAAVAFLFNPIAPIYMSKSTWQVMDFICAIIFFLASQVESIKK